MDVGGGTKEIARSKQYRYPVTSNLVIVPDRRPSSQVPSGEPESLAGRIDAKCFGDRAVRVKRANSNHDPDRCLGPPKRRRLNNTDSVLSLPDYESAYKLRTKEALAAYQHLLTIVEQQIGGQPEDILIAAADEVLSVFEKDAHNVMEKKREIEKLLGNIQDPLFDRIIEIVHLIKECQDPSGREEAFDDRIGVAVQFEDEYEEDGDNDDDDHHYVNQVEEEFEEEEVGPESTMQIDGTVAAALEEANEAMTVNVQDIDAYWLQRTISRAFVVNDALQSQKLAEEVLKVLDDGQGDELSVESRLVVLLEYEKFNLVKLLLCNRLKIVWCTRLARAESEEQKKRIEAEMEAASPSHVTILEQLHAMRASAKERETNLEKSIRDEAKRLKDDHSGGGDDREVDCEWLKAGRQTLPLETLAFHQGGLLMSKEKCMLPPGSYRTQHKGYDEVYVPALKLKPLAEGEELIQISTMPDWTQPAFPGMKQLNRVQSKVYETALFTPENILLCAPTGAGKTNIAVLTILHQIGLYRRDGVLDNSKYKVVYVAPMKALVAEVVRNLSHRLKSYNISVKELSGDQTLTRQQIEETQIIVTTPEKWDIITRKSGERTYTQMVKLLIIDEIHMLHDNRGPVLESIIARTVRQIETTKELIRLVGLSATLPNYEDVALFLRVNPSRGLFHFDNSYRPCPLHQQYIGISLKKPLQRFQLMNEICYERVVAAAGENQVLIFVHSRSETTKTACGIRDTALAKDTLGRFLKNDSASQAILQSQIELVKSHDLKDLLPYGFAIHHAGMARADRDLVEELFRLGHVQVLVSTATLAWGVNLPAHTVIIKGTQIYNPEKGAWIELSPLDVMQMLGRAGRPQFDTHGEGIILTGHSELQYYLSLMNHQLPIESQFISKLADQLNAEIVLGTVQNVREACMWIGYTYLYIRMLRNPTLYGVPADILDKDKTLDEWRADLIHSAANILDKHNLVKYDRKSGYFQVTDLGRIASYYYVTHTTISTYNEFLRPTIGDIELCRLFSLSEEFKYVTVRQDEKLELAKLLDCVPIPVKESLEEPSAKINILLQAYISRLKLQGLSLASDMVYVRQSAGRLMRALFEIVLKRGWAHVAEMALNMCKMVDKRMWSVQTPFLQFNCIPNEILLRLETKDLAWERYYFLTSQEIGELIRHRNMGRQLHKCLHQVPKLNLAAQVQPITRTTLSFELTMTPDFQWDDEVNGYMELFWVIVEDNDGECILHHECLVLKKQYIDEDQTLNFIVPITEPLPPQYFIRVVSDRWLGSQTVLPVSFKHLILPEKSLPPTELLDLQPLPVTALSNPSYEALYDAFKHFNPIQTQTFTVLYNTDDNVLVAAPSGSGKTVCAEFALLRDHQKASDGIMRAVYIAPVEALANEKYCEWAEKFGKCLGILVVKLTGETATDLKLLERGQIIISTPEKWDALSRRLIQCKHIQQVSLFIVDELHLIGGQMGHVLEVILSRMRRIASQIGHTTRIVALSASLSNANDLRKWIGVRSHGLFNFPLSARPVPLEIHLQGVNISSFEARMQAMTKPTYTFIVQHAKGEKPALVYVPTMKHARITALDLCTHSITDGREKPPFLLGSAEELETFISGINDDTLRRTLPLGVGFLHEGLSILDQEVVRQLFLSGRISVCVSSMIWGSPLPAYLIVIMGTQSDDGRESSSTGYSVPVLLHMMGYAGRPLKDASGKCFILCHASRKEYYKKFLYEALPVESQLHHFLHDHINAEIVNGVIENKQDAVDYLTWTFMYRRLTKNPNYYSLQGVSHQHLSDHLSELVEDAALNDLASSKCVAIEGMCLKPLNLGLIASYYYISYTTAECFSSSLNKNTKMKGLLETLASATEYAGLTIRTGDVELLQKLVYHPRFSFETPKFSDPHLKANALLQAYFARQVIVGNLAADQREVLLSAHRLLQAMVDVISSNGWLSLALSTMELCQMVIQGMWQHDSMLLQLPHFNKVLAQRCHENPGRSIETVFDLVEMNDDERRQLLQMPDCQLLDVAQFCNRFPAVDLTYEVLESDNLSPGENVALQVTLERDFEGRSEVGPVGAPRYPKAKEEGWWLVVGDNSDQLLAIKRVAVQRKSKVKLVFTAPKEAGEKSYRIYFMSDSYIGCDQEYTFTVNIKKPEKMELDVADAST